MEANKISLAGPEKTNSVNIYYDPQGYPGHHSRTSQLGPAFPFPFMTTSCLGQVLPTVFPDVDSYMTFLAGFPLSSLVPLHFPRCVQTAF